MTRGNALPRTGALNAQQAIVRALTEELGHVDAESPTAAGLRTQLVEESGRLAFLLAETDAGDGQTNAPRGVPGKDAAAHRRSRVLIVDDDDGTRTALARWLCEQYDVLTARDGEEGFALATASLPDVIVTDQWMPRVDGTSMVQRLKLVESTSKVPVIFLTGQTAEEGVRAGISAGAVAYLPKPIDLDALEHALVAAIAAPRQAPLRRIHATSLGESRRAVPRSSVARADRPDPGIAHGEEPPAHADEALDHALRRDFT